MIEFIEKVDSNWYYARNADLDMHEGLVLVRNLKIIKKLPGSNMVQGFEDGPCAIAKFPFSARKYSLLLSLVREGLAILIKHATWISTRIVTCLF